MTKTTDAAATAEKKRAAAEAAAAKKKAEAEAKAEQQRADDAAKAAEAATEKAKAEGRLPETMAVTNPSPAQEMDSASGAFIEPEIKAAIPTEHPSIENNPRAGTSAVQNGGDFNDPRRLHPSDPNFKGQGLDLSVYGKAADDEAKG